MKYIGVKKISRASGNGAHRIGAPGIKRGSRRRRSAAKQLIDIGGRHGVSKPG